MGFTLKHRELDSRGSFVAWGIGFKYGYDAAASVLKVTNARKQKPLTYIDFDDDMMSDPLGFTAALEKATQISALAFSNEQHLDLTELLGEMHLKVMLETSAMQARYSFDLEKENFERFERNFCDEYILSRLQFHKCENKNSNTLYYKGELETKNRNTVYCHHNHLHSVLKELSNKSLRDLMARECNYRSPATAQNLLAVSSNLHVISQILNKNMNPMHRVRHLSDKLRGISA